MYQLMRDQQRERVDDASSGRDIGAAGPLSRATVQ
jgi:hypothetical protein